MPQYTVTIHLFVLNQAYKDRNDLNNYRAHIYPDIQFVTTTYSNCSDDAIKQICDMITHTISSFPNEANRLLMRSSTLGTTMIDVYIRSRYDLAHRDEVLPRQTVTFTVPDA